ncbi:MAG: Ig-like domain-containing protein [Micrococcales bacterium]|nr:Ig-like domain-containing protein [Micrococcales bacterium]
MVADGIAHYTVKVYLRDANSNALTAAGGQNVSFSFDLGANSYPVTAKVDAAGVATTTFATYLAGTWQGTARYDGQAVEGGNPPVDLVFTPDTWSASHSTFTVSDNQVLANGIQKHWAKVQLFDAHGNPVGGQDVTFQISQGAPSVPGPSLNGGGDQVTVTTCDQGAAGQPSWCWANGSFIQGLAYVEITSEEPGTFIVTATSESVRIPSPGAVHRVSFTAGAPDATKSSWLLNPAATATNTVAVVANGVSQYDLTVTVKSVSDILVDAAAVRLNLRGASPSLLITGDNPALTGTPENGPWGQYTWQIASNFKGVYEFDVQVNAGAGFVTIGEPVVVRFIAGPPSAANSWLVEPAAASAAGAGSQVVVADIRDANGLAANDGEIVSFQVPAALTPSGAINVAVVDGKATMTLNSATAGTWAVTAKVGGDAIMSVRTGTAVVASHVDGNANVTWTHGQPSASNSQLTIPTAGATKVANGTDQHTAQVLVLDETGNNPVPGVQVLFTYGYDAAHQTTLAATSNASGIATIQFTSVKATTYEVNATINSGQTVTGSPAYASFVAGPVDPAKTLASLRTQGGVAKATGYQPLWAEMTAQDTNGNPVSGVALEFYLPYLGSDGPVFAPIATGGKSVTANSGADGVVRVDIVSTWQGTFEVKGRLGLATSGLPTRTVTFDNDAGDPDQSEWSIAAAATNPYSDRVVANGSDAYTASVIIRNAAGQELNGVGGTLTVTSNATGEARVIGFTTGHDGTAGLALVDVTSLVSGLYTVTVQLGGNPVATTVGGAITTQSIEFVAGPPHVTTTRLVSPAVPSIADGADSQVIRAEVRDAYGATGLGNPVPGVDVEFTIPAGVTAKTAGGDITGPDNVTIATATAGSDIGVAKLVLVATARGEYPVTAKVGSLSIVGGSPAKARFTSGDPSAEASTFVITTAGVDKAVRSENHQLMVEIFDAFSNPVDDRAVTVSFRWRLATSTGPWSTPVQVTTSNGVAVKDFTVDVAGTYVVEAYLSGGQVEDGKLATFVAGPASPGDSLFNSSAGLRVPNNGSSAHWANVKVLDGPGGNVVANEHVTFTVGGSATLVIGGVPCGQTCLVSSSLLGMAEVRVVNTVAELVRISASVKGSEVGHANLEFGPDAASAADSDWNVQPTKAIDASHPHVVANGSDSWTATVTVRDASPDHLPVGGAVVSFTVPGGVTIAPASGPYTTNSAGKVQVAFTSTKAGSYDVRARVGDYIDPNPITITFGAGPIDDPSSFLEGPTAAAIANGTDTAVVLAHVQDRYGNPVTDATVRFVVPAGTDVLGHEGEGLTRIDLPVDPDTGVATLTLVSTKAGSYNVTAQARRAGESWIPLLTGSPARVDFVAGPVLGANSVIWTDQTGPMEANDLDAYSVNVQLNDAFDNPVKQAGINVTLRFSLNGETIARTVQSGPEGVASYDFATTKAGFWQATAQVRGQAVEVGSPLSLAFVPGPVDWTKSKFWTSQSNVFADGDKFHWAKALLVDSYDNPIGDLPVDFAISAGAAGAASPWFDADSDQNAVQVMTCDLANQVGAPVWCFVEGVFQPGLAYSEIRSTQAGTFDVTAKHDGVSIEVAKRQVSFTAGKPDAGKSSWAITPDAAANPAVKLPATGLTANSYALTVTVRSAADLLVDGATVRLSGLPSQVMVAPAASGVTAGPGSASIGTFTWQLYSVTKGTFTGYVQVLTDAGYQTVGDEFTVRFGSDAASAALSWLEGPAVPAQAGPGAAQVVTARVYDVHGNPADSGDVVFHVPTTVGSLGTDHLTPNGDVTVSVVDGLASLTLNSHYAGTYEITASVVASAGATPEPLMSVKAPGSSLATANMRSDGIVPVTFSAGAADAANTELTVPTAAGGATKLADGAQVHTAQVTAIDSNGLNVVRDAQVRFQWTTGSVDTPNVGPWQTIAPDRVTDPGGLASYDHISHSSGWIWFRAFVQDSTDAWVEVANSPAKAKFVAGEVDLSASSATFVTYDQPVLNNMTDASWARVQLVDAKGNGIPGLDVTFTVPAGSTPVLLDAAGVPAGKSVTVATCDADLPADLAKADCAINGQFVEGLAVAYLVSAVEGSFTVSGVVDLGVLGPAPVGSGPVEFSAGAPSAAASYFSLTKTDAAAHHVVANGVDSYTLSATVTNGLTGASLLPVSGVCLTPALPAGVVVKDPAAGRGTCAAGQFQTNAAGQISVELVSTKAATYKVGVNLGAAKLATTAGGTTYTLDAVYVGGAPVTGSGSSYLTSPAAFSLADGVHAQVITATLLDAYGNRAQCFAANGSEAGCPVTFTVPAKTFVGQGAAEVAGPATAVIASGTSTDDLGLAKLELYSRTVGSYLVSAQVAGQDITVADGADMTPEAAQAKARFLTGPADPRQSVLSIPTAGASGTDTVLVSTGANTHTARVLIADAQGNGKADQRVIVSWQPVGASGSEGLRTKPLVTNADGLAEVSFASEWAGTYVVKAVLVLDEPWIDPVNKQSHEAEDHVTVTGSPANATFHAGRPAASGHYTYLLGPSSPAVANGTATQVITLVTHDDFGNPASCQADGSTGGCPVTWDTTTDAALGGLISSGKASVSSVTTTDANGKATITVTSLKAGTFKVGAGVKDVTLGLDNGAPASVQFTAGPAVAGASALTVAPSATNPQPGLVQANGSDSYDLVVGVMDANSNPAASVDVFFYITALDSPPDDATNPVLQTLRAANVDGQALAVLSKTVPGEFYVWATLGAEASADIGPSKVSGSPQLAEFEVGQAAAMASDVTAGRVYVEANRDDTKARGSIDTVTVHIVLRDANGHALSPAQAAAYVGLVEVSSTLAGTEVAGGGIATYQADGSFSVTVHSNAGGQTNLNLTVDGDLAPSVLQIQFVPTPAAPVYATGAISGSKQISGTGENGTVVTAVDTSSGDTLCTVAVVAGRWSCTLGTALTHGTEISAKAVRDLTATPSDLPGDHIFTSVAATTSVTTDTPAPPVVDPSDGRTITGQVDPDQAAGDGLWVVVTDPTTGDELCRVQAAPDGTFQCAFDPALSDGMEVDVTVENSVGGASPPVSLVISGNAPAQPWVDPTDGEEVTGGGQPGNTITITDSDGEELCRTTVGSDGLWKCTLQPPAAEGDIITIVETDPSGNSSRPVNWRVGLPRMVLGFKELTVGDPQTVVGYNFQPGESVAAWQYSTPHSVGVAKADNNGTVRYRYLIPQGTPVATHHGELSGALSGKVREPFKVIQPAGPEADPNSVSEPSPSANGALSFTGAAGAIGLIAAALAALLGGLVLLLAGKRRGQKDEEASAEG